MAIADNLAAVRARIAAACLAAGRDPAGVRLLPMSKTHPPEALLEARAAGVRRFGENRPQELAEKARALAGTDIEWAFAGHLQTNKAKLIATYAAEFQALDSLRLAADLDRRCQEVGRQLDVLVQVNTSGEPQKHGIEPGAALEFAAGLAAFDALRVRGLMTMAINSPDPARVAACFDRLAEVQTRLREASGGGWEELSMGMSGDFELAIARGATCVRVGTAVFGTRSAA
ncbi:MAG: YggS family pyridoxal phosphate-dependent enzyme [Propionibacteriaceae bacterium]|nr:YggS family pyridoxal phosphate-dependent enzyme [Propionibacteriaceae bacterium]